MKKIVFLILILMAFSAVPPVGVGVAYAQDATATPTVSEAAELETATATSPPDPTPEPTHTPLPLAGRPQIVVAEYYASENPVHAGSDLSIEIRFRNSGTQTARNMTIVFAGDNFYVRETGGVWSRSELAAGESFTIRQPLTASWSLAGYTVGATTVTASYTDESGTTYSDTFSLSVDIYFDSNWGKATATPVLGENPQVVVQGYHLDAEELKPGMVFTLEMDVANLGSRQAKGVKMSIAGATAATGGTTASTTLNHAPFATLDSSNLIYVGDLLPGETRHLSQRLIVDLKATAGVHTLPLTFQYSDEKGQQLTDNQGLTLIVHTSPQLKISFYENPGQLQVDTSSVLPIQVTNMGYQTSLLGDLHLTASQGILTGDMVYVGPLESGGSFTHDAEIVPGAGGSLEIRVEIDYNDAFGRPQTILQILSLQVAGEESPPPGNETSLSNGDGSAPMTATEETAPQESFWQKLGRFFRNLFGLGG